MAPHSSTLDWNIPQTEKPSRLQSMGSLRVGHDWATSLFSLSCIGEGNGNPLQCSCLENPRDRGAWWAAIYGIAQSQTRLKRFSSSSSSIQYSSKSDLIQKYLIQSHSLCKRETSHQVQTPWIWVQYDTCFWKLVLLSHIKK